MNIFRMKSIILLFFILCNLYHFNEAKIITATPPSTQTRLTCNQTLAPGSTLALTDKLDLSGRQPDQPKSIKDSCSIVGPSKNEEAATILVPANDCVLLAQGEVIISGNIRFVVGHKNRKFDCCDDGEGHGGVLCSYTNLTIKENAVVTIETTPPGDDTVIINPGIFWTGKFIQVDGIIKASLKYPQISGLNGLLSSSGIYVSTNGKVIGSGMQTIRGAAIQGGDDGTVINGIVECTNYTAGDAGGCIAAGKFLNVGPNAIIRARNGKGISGSSGLVVGVDHAGTFFGTIIAENMNTSDAGGILSLNSLNMSGNSKIFGSNIIARGGAAAITTLEFTMNDHANVIVNNSWGGDGGAIECTTLTMLDDSKVSCENSYADSQGACIASTIIMDDRASIIAKNMTSKALGGAIAGGYPKQYLIVNGNATIDIDGSRSGIYGGAMFFWENISFIGEAFEVNIRNSAAPCGGGIVTTGVSGVPGEGDVYLDTSDGGELNIENSIELNTTKGCLTIEANLWSGTVDKRGSKIAQPCGGGCGGKDRLDNGSCMCKSIKSGFNECCQHVVV